MNDPYLDEADLPPRPDRSRAYVVGGIAVVALVAFGGLIWYAYNLGSGQGNGVPTITAQTEPVRREPADPGGEKVEHTDKDVYNVLERQAAAANKPRVERLLPPPEVPMARPPEPPAPAAGAEPPPPASVLPAPGLNPPPMPQQATNVPPAPNAQPAAPRPGTPPAPAAPAAMPPATRPGDRNVAAAPPPAAVPAPPKPPAVAQNASPPTSASPSASTPPPAPPANREVASLPPAGAEPKPEAKPEPKPAENKPKPPPAAAQPTPKPGTGPVRVQFGAFRSEDEARNTWTKLRNQNGDLLGRLAFMTESVQRADGTVLHRVQGGTLSDAAAAQFLCDQMKARKVDCIVVKR